MRIHQARERLEVEEADLGGSSFSNASLKDSRFVDVGMVGAKFKDANLEAASIESSNLSGFAIRNCNLRGMKIDGVLVTELFAAWKGKPAPSSRTKTRLFEAARYQELLKRSIAQLESKTWFKKEGWIGTTSRFPRSRPTLASMHISKKNWFNEDGQGIHFEFFVSEKQAKRGEAPLALHLLHTPHIPGTRLKRISLSKPVVDAILETVASWDGYLFRAGRYGTQPFSYQLEFTEETLSADLVTQLARLCRTIGPVVDRELRKLLDG